MKRTKPASDRQGVLLAILLFALAGCGDASTSRVTGTVTYNGAPLPTGKIIFVPDTGRHATGQIVDGEIVAVTTFESGDGAPLGRNRVAVFSFESEPKLMEVLPSVVPKKYNDPATSGLEVDITADGINDVKLELTDD